MVARRSPADKTDQENAPPMIAPCGATAFMMTGMNPSGLCFT
jgi:hypothetical protein